MRDVNLDFVSTKKSIVIRDLLAPDEHPFEFEVHDLARVQDGIWYFFDQVKQSLALQEDDEAKEQLECVEVLSNQFDDLMIELKGFREKQTYQQIHDAIEYRHSHKKNTPDKEGVLDSNS